MRKLEWTAPALQDLDAIDAWLSTEADADVAVRMLTAIRRRADFLLDFPSGGPPISDTDSHSLRVRRTPYTLVYRLLGDERIEILRIHHAAQDWRGE